MRVTAGVNSFMRPKKLRKTLSAVCRSGIDKVVVGDDGKNTTEKQRVYEEMSKCFSDFTVLDLPFNHGLSATRNEIISHIDTGLFLMLDDDQYINEDVLSVKKFLEERPKVGGVGFPCVENGDKLLFAHDLFRMGECIVRDVDRSNKRTFQKDGHEYYLFFDLIPTCALFRIEVFDQLEWDERFVIGCEHLDFFWRAKKTDWKWAVCDSLPFVHDPGGTPNFESFRTGQRLKESEKHLRNKHDISGVIPSDLYFYPNYHTIKHLAFKTTARVLLSFPKGAEMFGGFLDRARKRAQRVNRNV